MRGDKLILKAVLSTLAAIVALIVLLFSALAIFFPSTMMQFTYKLGMEDASIHFAERAYNRSNEIYFAAFATEVAIGAGDFEEIDSCGEKFIKNKKFAAYCQECDEKFHASEGAYSRYIYGQVCVAKYKKGKQEKALARAMELNGATFTEGNPISAVLRAAILKKDKPTVEAVLNVLKGFNKTSEGVDAQALERAIYLAEQGLK